jgi:multiple antibiotic resistance protein
VPFAMPLLIGPGAISTVIIYAAEAKTFGWSGLGAGVGVIAAISLTILASFWLTGLISRVLGRIGMTIVVRVLGLILCAMAVQFMMAGIAGATHNLIRFDAATPYQHD